MALTIKEAVRKWGPEYLVICGLNKYFPAMTTKSHIFFVDGGSGDDGANTGGQIPEEPFLTITKALSECTSGAGDFIFVLDYYQATGETWPIAITKQRVHIIGCTEKGTPWPWVCPTGDTAAFEFQGNSGYSEICGFEIGAGDNHGCIETTHSGIEGLHIHDIVFASEIGGMTAKYGIYTHTGGVLMKALIENCNFGGGISADGILISGSTGAHSVKGCRIKNNFFRVDGIGINIALAANLGDGGIFDNRFVISSDAAGKAIDLVAGVTGGLIDGNQSVWDDGTDATTNGYRTITACDVGWGLNYIADGAIGWPATS